MSWARPLAGRASTVPSPPIAATRSHASTSPIRSDLAVVVARFSWTTSTSLRSTPSPQHRERAIDVALGVDDQADAVHGAGAYALLVRPAFSVAPQFASPGITSVYPSNIRPARRPKVARSVRIDRMSQDQQSVSRRELLRASFRRTRRPVRRRGHRRRAPHHRAAGRARARSWPARSRRCRRRPRRSAPPAGSCSRCSSPPACWSCGGWRDEDRAGHLRPAAGRSRTPGVAGVAVLEWLAGGHSSYAALLHPLARLRRRRPPAAARGRLPGRGRWPPARCRWSTTAGTATTARSIATDGAAVAGDRHRAARADRDRARPARAHGAASSAPPAPRPRRPPSASATSSR